MFRESRGLQDSRFDEELILLLKKHGTYFLRAFSSLCTIYSKERLVVFLPPKNSLGLYLIREIITS